MTQPRRETANWTTEEDDRLREWQRALGNKWSQIAKHMPGRSGQQCAQRWRHKGNPEISRAKWTAAEDAALRKLVHEQGSCWAQIARQLPGRTDQQCMGRWRRHLDPGIKFGAWDAWEDRKLQKLADELGTQWSKIAQSFGDRTAQQCRARWVSLFGELSTEPLGKRARDSAAAESPRRNMRQGLRTDAYDAEVDTAVDEAAASMTARAGAHRVRGHWKDLERAGQDQEASRGNNRKPVHRKRGRECTASSPKLPCEMHVPRRSRAYSGLPLREIQPVVHVGKATSLSASATFVQPPVAPSIPHTSGAPRNNGVPAKQAEKVVSAGSQTLVHVDTLFFWLQLILLRPLQPVVTDLDRSLAKRMSQLATLSAATFAIFCAPRLRVH